MDLWKSRGPDSHTPTPVIDHKNGDDGSGLNLLGPGSCPDIGVHLRQLLRSMSPCRLSRTNPVRVLDGNRVEGR